MSDQADTGSKFINVDLEQWRRDIDTFAAATTSALDAIISDLSTVCSGGQVSSVAQSPPIQMNPVNATQATDLQQTKIKTIASRPVTASGSTEKSAAPSNGGNRLASLKEKLASRINKN